MNNLLRILIAVLVLLAIVAFMTTYTVRFTEKAVVTRFGDIKSIKVEPGLGFKWPYPIESVIKYDTRDRFVETKPQTVQTADNKQIIVSVFVTWRVDDPLKFFQTYGPKGSRAQDHFRAADNALQDQLDMAAAQASNFKLTELLGLEGGGNKLADLESSILASLRVSRSGTPLAEQGMEARAVGISSLRLPDSTAKEVFERMKATRVNLATTAAAQGNALAGNIVKKATDDAAKIMGFAERRAKGIRGQGELEAAKYYAQMASNTDLATFERSLEFMRSLVSRQSTLVLSPNTPGLGIFNFDVLAKMRAGEVPVLQDPLGPKAPTSRAAPAPAPGSAAVATLDTAPKEPR